LLIFRHRCARGRGSRGALHHRSFCPPFCRANLSALARRTTS
jgi:hypothetical protein